MPSNGRVIYWDSNVFVSYINGIPERLQTIKDMLAEIVDDQQSFILTSSESIVEVSHAADEKVQSRLDPTVEAAIDAMWNDTSVVRIIDNGPPIAHMARDLIRDSIPHGWTLKPKDAVHLASAFWYDQNVDDLNEFHTYDDRLFKYEAMIGIRIDYPHVLQHRMNLDTG